MQKIIKVVMGRQILILLFVLLGHTSLFGKCNSCNKVIEINNHIIEELNSNSKLFYYSNSRKTNFSDTTVTVVYGDIPYISKLYKELDMEMDLEELNGEYMITYNFLVFVRDWIENNCSEKMIGKAVFISEKQFDYILDHIED